MMTQKEFAKWLKTIHFIMAIMSAGIIVYDLLNITIMSFITKRLDTWTFVGFVTFILSTFIFTKSADYIKRN